MSRLDCRILLITVLSLFGTSLLAAVGQAQESAVPKAAPLDVDKLIKQLDAEEFGTRQEASQRLTAAGEKAIPALEKAVQSDSREVSSRAFEILKNHFEKGSPGVKEAARQAFDRLAKAELGSTSRLAAEILTPPKSATPNGLPPGVIAPGGLRIAVGRVAIAAGAVGGGVETKIKIEDGVKTTEIKDKDRQVKIVDDPMKGIQLEVTETKDGKETTKKYEAKDAAELKTKDAEAHKIYEQYSQKGAEIKIGGGIIGGVPVPLAPRVLPRRLVPAIPAVPGIPIEVVPAAETKKQAEALESLEKSLQEAESNLKQLSKDLGDNEQVAKARVRLEEARKQLEQLRSALK